MIANIYGCCKNLIGTILTFELTEMHNQSGFTMIELITAFVIIGALAAFSLPKLLDVSSGAEALTCQGNQATAATAVAISFSESAIAGNAGFPDKLKKEMFRQNAVPACPYAPWDSKKNQRKKKKKVKYDKKTGTTSCPHSIATHAQ